MGLAGGEWHDIEEYTRKHRRLNTTTITYQTGTRQGRVRALLDTVKEVDPKLVVGVNIPDCYLAAAKFRGKKRFPKIAMTLHAIQPDFYDDVKENTGVLDAIVCTNRLACALVNIDAGIDESRIFYAPYGVAFDVDIPAQNPYREPFCIAYVGRLERNQKLVHDLPAILKNLEIAGVDFKLLIAGSGPEEQWMKRELAGRIENKTVEFLGAIELHEMKRTVYARTDALIVTSSWETGPIVIWEAMASGVPVVTSRYIGSGLENSLIDGVNCLMFPPGDSREAAACIKQIIDNELAAKLITGGYHLVAGKYNRNSSVDAWERCFSEILASSVDHDMKTVWPTIPPSGRLDLLFGTEFGETIRANIGKRYVHQSPGSEWPHSYGVRDQNDVSFWTLAKTLDGMRN